jgi:hypothetical protein
MIVTAQNRIHTVPLIYQNTTTPNPPISRVGNVAANFYQNPIELCFVSQVTTGHRYDQCGSITKCTDEWLM